MVAGYCWNWTNNPDYYDICIPEYDFKMSWNLANKETWAIDQDSVKEVGCVRHQ